MELKTVVSTKRIQALFEKQKYEMATGNDAVTRPITGEALPLVSSVYEHFNQEVTDRGIIAAYPVTRLHGSDNGRMDAVMMGIYEKEAE